MLNNHFTVIVAGDNPDEIMAKYDSNKKVEPYLVYKFSEIKDYKDKTTQLYKKMLEAPTLSEEMKCAIQSKIDDLEHIDDIDFYMDFAKDYDIKEETGDAYSDQNPYGRYTTCNVGGKWALPLIDYNGKETYSCKKGDIDFGMIHMTNPRLYEAAWEMIMEGREPKNKDEQTVYENMKNRTSYFESFGTKEKYVAWSTSFWALAFVDKEQWYEFDEEGDLEDQIKWVTEFYDRFIKKLPKKTLITVYECTREN